MFKSVMLLFLFLFCSSYGILKNISVKYRVFNLRKAKELVYMMRNEINFSGRDLYSVSERLSDLDDLGILRYLSNKSFSPSENYEYAKERIGKGMFLIKSDWKILDEFFYSLGSTSREGQISLCDKSLDLIEKQEEEAENTYLKYSKLYTSSGILVGLFLVIILI